MENQLDNSEEFNDKIDLVAQVMRQEFGTEIIEKMVECYKYYTTEPEFINHPGMTVEFGRPEIFLGCLLTHTLPPMFFGDSSDIKVQVMRKIMIHLTKIMLELDVVKENKTVFHKVNKTLLKMQEVI